MPVNPFPYAGSDWHEHVPVGGRSLGQYTREGGSETKIFFGPAATRDAFIKAMLGRATLPNTAEMLAASATVEGKGAPDAAALPGYAEYSTAFVEIEYRPAEQGDEGSDGAGGVVTYKESGSYHEEGIGLPNALYYASLAANNDGRRVPDGFAFVPLTIRQRTWEIGGLATFSPDSLDNVIGRIDASNEAIRFARPDYSKTFYPDGSTRFNVTVGIDIRPNDSTGTPISWQKFYVSDRNPPGWDYYYVKPTPLNEANRFLPYQTGAILTYLTSLGIRL